MLLRLVPAGTTIPFVRFRRIYLALSVALLILSGAMFFGQGLNFGIDFKGGILLYTGKDILPLRDKRLLAVPISELWKR